jgi:energy-coupling factor transport system ATP-binding protein
MPEQKVGEVMKFFSKASVAAIKVTEGSLRVGDRIKIKGHTTDFEDQIQSMQVENQPVEKADVGQMIGIKVKDRVREKDVVYKIVEWGGSIPQPIVDVERLTHIYNRGTPLEKKAIEDISLQIERGEFIGIIGETGSGKSTLVQHFNGLLKPSGGRVVIEGMDLALPGISWNELRQRVGLVFQYPEQQLFEATVFDDISFVLRQRKVFSPAEVEHRVESACVSVGLDYEEFRSRSPFELSGGEKRRVALAGVLVQEPHLLILDEPTVGLDGPGKREILKQVEALHHSGKTVIIISHAVEDLLGMVNRLVVLESGRLLTTGAPAEVFSFLLQTGKVTSLVPSIYQLCHDLRAEGWDIPEGILAVEEAVEVLDRSLRSPTA